MNAYGPVNNNAFNSSKANIAKLLLLTFLGVQSIRQLVYVNDQAGAKTESRSGQVAAWMTITMTLVAAYALYAPKTPSVMAMIALVIAAMGSGVAMIYGVLKNDVKPEKYRLFFGIAHVILAVLVSAYLIATAT